MRWIFSLFAMACVRCALGQAAELSLTDKTLVAWVSPANLTQQGGRVLTIDDRQDHFDGIVFAEVAPARWMAGSDLFRRTEKQQEAWPAETADAKTFVQVAAAYRGKQVALYRDGKEYARYEVNEPQTFGKGSAVVMGLRHLDVDVSAFFAGAIDDARIYGTALTGDQLAALKPNQPSDPEPLAWWSFEDGAQDRTGRFPEGALVGAARVADGKLVLDGKGSCFVAPASAAAKLPAVVTAGKAADAAPGFSAFFFPEQRAFGDTFPIYRDGVWHLFCIWMPQFGHFVTRDLVHWEARPPTPFGGCTGCIVEKEGTYYFYYTGGGQQIWLATSKDLENWTQHPGNPLLVGDGKRYDPTYFRDPYVFFEPAEKTWWMLMGSQYVADRKPGEPTGCVALAKSADLLHWELADPLWAPRLNAHCDCPQVFQQGDRWYLTYLHNTTRYRTARTLAGPWERPPLASLGSMMAAAGSRPASDGKRWISWPFVFAVAEPKDLAPVNYGGPLCVPREWGFQADGRITQRVPDEVVRALHAEPAGGKPLDKAEPGVGTWELAEGATASSSDPAGGILRLAGVPEDFYLEADLTLDRQDMEANVLLSYGGDRFACYCLSLSPREGLLKLRGTDPCEHLTLETLPLTLDISRPIKLRVFRSGSILEVFVGEEAVLTKRLYKYPGAGVGLEFRDGRGAFANLLVRRLAHVP